MEKNGLVLLICSENPGIIKNGITAALNTSLRSLQYIFKTVDIYIHKSKKLIVFPANNELILHIIIYYCIKILEKIKYIASLMILIHLHYFAILH